jgi:uncharacterized protein (DUF1684 family)
MFKGCHIFLFTFVLCFTVNISAQQLNSYELEIEQWKLDRIISLKKESGWLNLAGLFWLEQGSNSFGTGAKNNIVFPKRSLPDVAGNLILQNSVVTLVNAKGVNIKVNDQNVQQRIIFSTDSNKTPIVSYGSYHWTIIKREDKVGIRLRDYNNALVKKFNGTPRFKTDSLWKFNAILKEPIVPTTIPITNVLGQTIQMKLLGKLIFSLKGEVISLDAVEEENQLFIIFGDATNGKQTYGAGRFLYADKPDASGRTIVDFNKAFNPPCAFTPFATCPLPPKQNIIAISVTAGEKKYETADRH